MKRALICLAIWLAVNGIALFLAWLASGVLHVSPIERSRPFPENRRPA